MGKIKLTLSSNFTITTNEFLQDKKLGLTERGLLATMLSLPPDWRYSIVGLATLTPDKKAKVGKAISNLEKLNYLRRSYVRKDGKIVSADYTFSGKVLTDDVANENATTLSNNKVVTEKSVPGKLVAEKLPTENESGNIVSKNKVYNNTISTDTSNPSISHDEIREIIRNNIDYDCWITTYKSGNTSLIYGDLKRLDEIIEIIVDCFVGTSPTIHVAGNNIPRADVQTRLFQLNQFHIEYVFDCMDQSNSDIKNPKAYLLTALYNAPVTIDNYYANKTRYDAINGISKSD